MLFRMTHFVMRFRDAFSKLPELLLLLILPLLAVAILIGTMNLTYLLVTGDDGKVSERREEVEERHLYSRRIRNKVSLA